MSKFFEAVGSVLIGAVVATASGVEKACEVVASSTCDAVKIVVNVAEGVADVAKSKSENDSKGNR